MPTVKAILNFIVVAILFIASCTPDEEHYEDSNVYAIIQENFSRFPVGSKLMPVYHTSSWSEHLSRQNLPLRDASRDTINYSDSFLQKLLRKGILTSQDLEFMQSVMDGKTGVLKTESAEFDLVEIEEVRRDNMERRKAKLRGRRAYTQVSRPIYNKTKDKVLLSVSHTTPPEYIAWVYVFALENNEWKIIYSDVTAIS